MIKPKVQALFNFIDFLDENKKEYIEKYLPLCNELRALDNQKQALNPNDNYKDKLSYDKIQNQIAEKFPIIKENIYKPITDKLQELGIWLGDDGFSSIWNGNFSEISSLKENFSESDKAQIFIYKQKYLDFRAETNSNFLSLAYAFEALDTILKVLFDFFRDTNENEFKGFETNVTEVASVVELVKSLKENKGKGIQNFVIAEKMVSGDNYTEKGNKLPNIKNEVNINTKIYMGDQIQTGDISNNSGQIAVGKGNKTEVNSSNPLAKKTFPWEKVQLIVDIVALIFTVLQLLHTWQNKSDDDKKITGVWSMTSKVIEADLKKYIGLEIKWRLFLTEKDQRVKGTAEKIAVNNEELKFSDRTKMDLEGHIKDNVITLNYDEYGKQLTTTGILTVTINGNKFNGNFSQTASNSKGEIVGYKLE